MRDPKSGCKSFRAGAVLLLFFTASSSVGPYLTLPDVSPNINTIKISEIQSGFEFLQFCGRGMFFRCAVPCCLYRGLLSAALQAVLIQVGLELKVEIFNSLQQE